jgi:hypothetical protein
VIEDKDFVMRIISRLGALLRLILKGQADRSTEMEVEDALADLAGLPTTMLLSMTPDSVLRLLLKLPNQDSIALSGVLLVMKGRLAKNAAYEATGRQVIAAVSPGALTPEIRALTVSLLEDESAENTEKNPEK